MTDKELLLATADLLESDGWCRGVAHDGRGRRCLLGAAFDVGDSIAAEMVNALWRTHLGISASAWNDEQTDRRTVLRTLRKLAQEV